MCTYMEVGIPAVRLGSRIVVGLSSSDSTLSLAVLRRTMSVACVDEDVTDLGPTKPNLTRRNTSVDLPHFYARVVYGTPSTEFRSSLVNVRD